jgi:hypothetical protein
MVRPKTDVERVVALVGKYGLHICWGLAPNPFGFSFEATGNKRLDKRLSDLLFSIDCSHRESAKLRKALYG